MRRPALPMNRVPVTQAGRLRYGSEDCGVGEHKAPDETIDRPFSVHLQSSGASSHHAHDGIAVGDLHRPVADAAQFSVRINAEQVENGGGQIVGADRIARGI